MIHVLSRIFMLAVVTISLMLASPLSTATAQKPTLPDSWADQIPFRSIGPANMMGRITSIAVYEKDPNIWWAASASGGLIKTSNNGLDFEHQFDDQSTVSIGDVQVSQSDPNLVWVGTGEANPRNSVSWGDGVYKSTDGGDCGGPTKNAVCSRRPTAARRGKKCCTSTTRPVWSMFN